MAAESSHPFSYPSRAPQSKLSSRRVSSNVAVTMSHHQKRVVRPVSMLVIPRFAACLSAARWSALCVVHCATRRTPSHKASLAFTHLPGQHMARGRVSCRSIRIWCCGAVVCVLLRIHAKSLAAFQLRRCCGEPLFFNANITVAARSEAASPASRSKIRSPLRPGKMAPVKSMSVIVALRILASALTEELCCVAV